MRYQIHRLQQEALIELGLNTEDALLLDWMLNWKDGNSMERIIVNNNDVAYWVNYSKVIEELPILFKKTKGFNSVEEEEKAKKANTTKVARMLKGNLSKVLSRHEKKVQGKTKIYISFNREMLDYLINRKEKAPTFAEVEASENKNHFSNNSIAQSSEKNTKKNELEEITKSDILKVISESCVNIKKQDLKDCQNEFLDIDKLRDALKICEVNNNHGIKALRMAYKYGDVSIKKDKKKVDGFYMVDSKVMVDGKLKSVKDLTEEELELKIAQKWGRRHL